MGACITTFHGAADVVLQYIWGSGAKGQGKHLEKEHTKGSFSEEFSSIQKQSG